MNWPLQKNFRTLFWGCASLALFFLFVTAFWPKPALVDMSEVIQGPMITTVRDEGRTRVRNIYEVTAPLSGRLLRVHNKAGDAVTIGETIARILPSDPALLDARTQAEAEAARQSAEAALNYAQAELERASSALAHAQSEAKRAEALFASDAISESAVEHARLELRTAQANRKTANANLNMRQADLETAKVRLSPPGPEDLDGGVLDVGAPISGRILRVMQESEKVISAGTQLMEIGNPSNLEIVLELLSTDAVRVEEGARVIIERWGEEKPLEGHVRLIEPLGFLKLSALGVEEQRVNVIVDILDPPSAWSALGHGYRVEGAVVTWEGDNVVQVPVAALFRNNEGWAVFRVELGRARLTALEIGHNNGQNAEVLSGVAPGETVVLYPGQQLEDGARVVSRSSEN